MNKVKYGRNQGRKTLSYTIYLEIVLSAAERPQKHGGCDVTGVNLGYDVHAVIHWPRLIWLRATWHNPPGFQDLA